MYVWERLAVASLVFPLVGVCRVPLTGRSSYQTNTQTGWEYKFLVQPQASFDHAETAPLKYTNHAHFFKYKNSSTASTVIDQQKTQ